MDTVYNYVLLNKSKPAVSINRYDRSVSIMFVLFIIMQTFNTVIKNNVASSFIENYLTILLAAFYLLFFLFQLKAIKKAIISIVFLELIFGLLLASSLLRNIEFTLVILSRCIWTIAFCIPLFALFLYVDDYQYVLNKSLICILPITIMSFFSVYKFVVTKSYTYDMSLGYFLLYPLILSFTQIKRNIAYLVPLIIDLLFIVIIGSRGPLLCFLVFLIMYVFLYYKSPKSSVIKLFVIVFVVLLLFFYKLILSLVLDFFANRGITSRTLNKLIDGSIWSDSGRSAIYNLTFKTIGDNPIFGIGVAGELTFMKSYPHLVFLEIVMHYGMPLGIALCGFIIYYVIKSLFISRFNNLLHLVLLCTGLVPLLLSGTYLQTPLFWMAIAVSISVCKRRLT